MPAMVVVFFFSIALPGAPPFRQFEPMPNLIACFTAEMEFLSRAAQRALVDGRVFSAGCTVMVAPSIEH